MHDQLFLNNQDLRRRDLLRYAEQLGLEEEAFEDCLGRSGVQDQLIQDVTWARERLRISGTPTFWVNGRRVNGAHPLKVEAIIRYELEAAGIMDMPADEMGVFAPVGGAVEAAANHEPPPPQEN